MNMMNKAQDKAYFLSFCIEQYKNAKGLSGKEAAEYLAKYGVLDYLCDNFEVLHTQGWQWLLADIEDYIRSRQEGRER